MISIMKEGLHRERIPIANPILIGRDTKLPILSKNLEERGEQLALLYVNGVCQSFYYESEHRSAIQDVLLNHAKLLGNVHVDTNWYMGMQDELLLKQLQNITDKTHAALEESPFNPVKQVEYAQALQAENNLAQRMDENNNNLPGYVSARDHTDGIIDDLVFVFTDTEKDREHRDFSPMAMEEAEELALGIATEVGVMMQWLGEIAAD